MSADHPISGSIKIAKLHSGASAFVVQTEGRQPRVHESRRAHQTSNLLKSVLTVIAGYTLGSIE
jgi:hypothetical protein